MTQVGDTAGAIQHYELAGTHCVEVPRMLYERGRVEDLEEYITQVPFTKYTHPGTVSTESDAENAHYKTPVSRQFVFALRAHLPSPHYYLIFSYALTP